ncbi:MAG: hypothetical protein AAF756_15575 [Pseudomonadota bacterium]
MTDTRAVFLSASVPESGRPGSDSFDALLINAAVHAFVEVVLGRRLLVWGGQPAITPMIWEAARRLGVSYRNSVKLYQSAFFKERYPEVNVQFDNWEEIEADPEGKQASLARLRHEMFMRHDYEAAVFIGGMEGVEKEFDALYEYAPNARLIPIPSPGGMSRELFSRVGWLPQEMIRRTDYTYWLYKTLEIDPSEPRSHFD